MGLWTDVGDVSLQNHFVINFFAGQIVHRSPQNGLKYFPACPRFGARLGLDVDAYQAGGLHPG
jgi:hypothetical protein